MSNKVLFLGVTNRCASRFAEIMFNHLAGEQLLNYHSQSRGVIAQHQEEPLDSRTINALTARGVLMTSNLRAPKVLDTRDIKQADYIVLISGSELSHRLERAKGIEEKQIIVWDFNHVNTLLPHELYPALEAEVYLLIRRLQQKQYKYAEQLTA